MTEYEKYCSAKRAVDSLANGLNPFDGEPLPDDTILNNVHVARALFVASDALNFAIAISKKGMKKQEFDISAEQLQNFQYSMSPIPVTEFARRIDALNTNEFMKKFSYKAITDWLESEGFLERIVHGDKSYRKATAQGVSVGITSEWRQSSNGVSYLATSYDEKAQHFIIDNLPEIIASRNSEEEEKTP